MLAVSCMIEYGTNTDVCAEFANVKVKIMPEMIAPVGPDWLVSRPGEIDTPGGRVMGSLTVTPGRQSQWPWSLTSRYSLAG